MSPHGCIPRPALAIFCCVEWLLFWRGRGLEQRAELRLQNHLFSDETAVHPARTATLDSARCGEFLADPEWHAGKDRWRYPWHPRIRHRGAGAAVLHGTGFMQQAIFEHQHPLDCSRARFVAFVHFPYGLGASLQYLSKVLGFAMQARRVLILLDHETDTKMDWRDRNFCPGEHSWNCYFQPLSKCVPEPGQDILLLHGWDVERLFKGDAAIGDLPGLSMNTTAFVPSRFHELLESCSPIKKSMWHYWWHAQIMTYIIRFNHKTRRAIDALRATRVHQSIGSAQTQSDAWSKSQDSERNWAAALAANSSKLSSTLQKSTQSPRLTRRIQNLPSGAISVYIRRGRSKQNEMQETLRFERYAAEVEHLMLGQAVPVLHPDFADSQTSFDFPPQTYSGRVVFLNGDWESDFDAARRHMSANGRWNLAYFDEEREDDWMDGVAKRSWSSVALNSFLGLELALEADAWVCTLISNWCRIIDQLRMTVAAKLSNPYVDLPMRSFRFDFKCPVEVPMCYADW